MVGEGHLSNKLFDGQGGGSWGWGSLGDKFETLD